MLTEGFSGRKELILSFSVGDVVLSGGEGMVVGSGAKEAHGEQDTGDSPHLSHSTDGLPSWQPLSSRIHM